MQKIEEKKSVHLWVPNLFEFKGGIQVYLQDVLQALNDEFPKLSLSILDKLDQEKPQDQFNSHTISFFFSGGLPRSLQTLHFAINLTLAAFREHPNLILCGHLNFAPIALWINRMTRIPYWIIVYGTDAWEVQDQRKIKALHAADKLISISSYTSNRLIIEQEISPKQISLLPVTFDAKRFKISHKPDYLLKRYGLDLKQKIILTVSRFSRFVRYKG